MGVSELVNAANGGVPDGELKPHNCHEAALGWVLLAKYDALRLPNNMTPAAVPKAWMTIRSLANQHGESNPKQLTGRWMSHHIYNRGVIRVQPPFTSTSYLVGDVLFLGNRDAPHHSMVVAQRNGRQVFARGFNDADQAARTWVGSHPARRH